MALLLCLHVELNHFFPADWPNGVFCPLSSLANSVGWCSFLCIYLVILYHGRNKVTKKRHEYVCSLMNLFFTSCALPFTHNYGLSKQGRAFEEVTKCQLKEMDRSWVPNHSFWEKEEDKESYAFQPSSLKHLLPVNTR